MSVAASLSRPRIATFDLIRGLFLVLIGINHLAIAYGPSVFLVVTGASHLPASAAEGFFLISGIMVGYVYGAKILAATWPTFKKLWKRAGLLWLLCVFFTMLYTAWAVLYPGSEVHSTLYSRSGESFLYNSLLLRFAFGWADFLSRYAWFMFLAPIALWLIAKKLWWVVAAASIGVWALFRSTEFLLPFSAWQVVFIAGIFIGYYFPAMKARVVALKPAVKQVFFHSIVWVSVLTYAIALAAYVIVPWLSESYPTIYSTPLGQLCTFITTSLAPYIDKATLDPLRLGIGIVWFTALYLVFHRFESLIQKGTHGTLELLGKNSLFVYTTEAFLLFIAQLYLRPFGGSTSLIVNTLLAIILIVATYYLTKYKSAIQSAPKRVLQGILKA